MSEAGPLLELIDVGKTYGPAADPNAPAVLEGLNLAVAAGETLAVVGPSGCGKSTLLNIIGTLDRPTSGQVLLDGKDLAVLDDKALAGLRGRQIGFVFQLHHLLPQCSILENVLLPTLAAGKAGNGEPPEQRARRLLERVGLSHRLSYRPGELSGGERQRAAVVRALINAPKLLLADEPTGSLDRASADNLGELLVELNGDEGVTLIVVTHSIELAGRMSRVLELRNGTLSDRGEDR
ncbi:MAG TPA: ABC transporter ATP-binding protein [Phycisphaerae bacterium]|nr:ABC transporter ATP-binding protein [Phycisphaerae bacterium]